MNDYAGCSAGMGAHSRHTGRQNVCDVFCPLIKKNTYRGISTCNFQCWESWAQAASTFSHSKCSCYIQSLVRWWSKVPFTSCTCFLQLLLEIEKKYFSAKYTQSLVEVLKVAAGEAKSYDGPYYLCVLLFQQTIDICRCQAEFLKVADGKVSTCHLLSSDIKQPPLTDKAWWERMQNLLGLVLTFFSTSSCQSRRRREVTFTKGVLTLAIGLHKQLMVGATPGAPQQPLNNFSFDLHLASLC